MLFLRETGMGFHRGATAAALAVLVGLAASPAPAQTVTQFNVPSGAHPTALGPIIAGPDGALWFTDEGNSVIGRITTSGTISEFATPTANSSPTDIVAGSDGALWFIETNTDSGATFNGAKIGRITTAGVITEFPIPSSAAPFGPGAVIGGLTSGSDGALHFYFLNSTDKTCPSSVVGNPAVAAYDLGRLTTTLGLTTTISQCTIEPFSMTQGSDGNLWATAAFLPSLTTIGVGSINSSNMVTTAPGPSATTSTGLAGVQGGIAAGPDGRLWTFDAATNQIVSVTVGGVFNEFTVPTPKSGLSNITMGPDGALWFTESVGSVNSLTDETTAQIGRIGTGGTIAEFTADPTFPPIRPNFITAGPDGAMWYTISSGGIFRMTVPASTGPLVAAVLPASRSITIGGTATAFATIINAGSSQLSGCAISPVTSIPASFVYQTTNPTTNALTGTANTPATIAAGGSQSFVFAFTGNGALAPTNVVLGFACTGADAAPTTTGVNTLLFSISATPVPDIVALAASGDPGFVDVPGASGAGAFAVASVNLGAGGTITVAADTGAATLPVMLTVCQTVPSTGACMATPTASVTTTINANDTPTFGIFAQGSGTIPFAPGSNRVFVRFTDSSGATRGATSVAIRTQ